MNKVAFAAELVWWQLAVRQIIFSLVTCRTRMGEAFRSNDDPDSSHYFICGVTVKSSGMVVLIISLPNLMLFPILFISHLDLRGCPSDASPSTLSLHSIRPFRKSHLPNPPQLQNKPSNPAANYPRKPSTPSCYTPLTPSHNPHNQEVQIPNKQHPPHFPLFCSKNNTFFLTTGSYFRKLIGRLVLGRT